jgi:hypothetical protein
VANLNMDSMNSENSATAPSVQVRRGYSAPKLTVYGDVSELTENGAGSLSEGNTMVAMMRFP